MNIANIKAQADANLLKEITRLIHRIERIFVPINSTIHSTIGAKLDGVVEKLKLGLYFADVKEFPANDLLGYDVKSVEPLFRRVDWGLLEAEIRKFVGDGEPTYELPAIVKEEIMLERAVHDEKYQKASSKERVRRLQRRNGLPVLPGKWRKDPYAARTYEALSEYSVTNMINDAEGKDLKDQLRTPLNGFLGQAYNYDDHDLTEEWMLTFQDKSSNGPTDDDVIRTQLESLLEIMMVAVQDRVCTQTGVLQRAPLALGVDIKEVPVWGIDCYTRRMIEMSIEDRVPKKRRNADTIRLFIEKVLLPTINSQPPELAHNMQLSVSAILKQSNINADNNNVHSNPTNGISNNYSALDIEYTTALAAAITEHTIDMFRIHPKGTGVVCINPAGIQPHVFVSQYLGELYPSYRWCERLDVVEQAQQTFELKPTLPDFYNILLERPRQDPKGYGLLYVDASQKANVGSSCSHSCNANCTSAVVARNGQLTIALTTNRYIAFGEELTMDYYSITTSDMEWRAAICLCGASSCRGSFLHFATQDDLQQVLNQNCGPLWRYASLLRACANRPLSASDSAVLGRHGMQSAALGTAPPNWVKKYAVDNLRFVEFERKALPCALLRRNKDSSGKNSSDHQHRSGKNSATPSANNQHYSFSAADMDARSVMEQRLQSMVCCFSMVQQVIAHNDSIAPLGKDNGSIDKQVTAAPLVPYQSTEAVNRVWIRLATIPQLIEEYLLQPVVVDSRNEVVLTTTEIVVSSISGGSVDAFDAGSSGANSSKSSNSKNSSGKSKQQSKSSNSNSSNNSMCSVVIAKIQQALVDVKALLIESNRPYGLAKLRELCLSLRSVLQRIESLSTATARINQLCDVLVFWAFTSNYSTVQDFAPVESGPVTVFARELGTNIPRNKIFKLYQRNSNNADTGMMRRRGDKNAASSSNINNITGSASMTAIQVEMSPRGVTNNSDNTSEITSATTTESATVAVVTPTSPSSSSSSAVFSAHCSSNLSTSVMSGISSTSCLTDLINESTTISSNSSDGDGSHDRVDVNMEEDSDENIAGQCDTDIDNECVSRDSATVSSSSSSLSLLDITTTNALPSSVSSPSLHNSNTNREFYLSPNEPVFLGTKKYPKLFTFWQLMGWFNAGTDEKTVAPDLFGCVELPVPVNCFGVAEGSYTSKQRDMLMELLRDEKAQTMSWPAALKSSFTFEKSSNNNNTDDASSSLSCHSSPLYGSPMLDIALGQVGVMSKVLDALRENSSTSVTTGSSNGKSGKKGNNNGSSSSSSSGKKNSAADSVAQFDNILPPEMPTSWVQCELCRQWRRVAWHVDADSLPDLWECHMNTWDPDNANCQAPQDGYDPDAENTLGFSTSQMAHIDVNSFTIGKKFDLYCNRNKVYYEASVKKVKPPNSKRAGDKAKVQFHFIGWSAQFDEWITIDSDRIQPHNLHTNPTTNDPREQERWQGLKNAYVLVTAKKNSGNGNNSSSSSKKKPRDGDEEVVNNTSTAATAGTAMKRKSPANKRKSSPTSSDSNIKNTSHSIVPLIVNITGTARTQGRYAYPTNNKSSSSILKRPLGEVEDEYINEAAVISDGDNDGATAADNSKSCSDKTSLVTQSKNNPVVIPSTKRARIVNGMMPILITPSSSLLNESVKEQSKDDDNDDDEAVIFMNHLYDE